MPQAAKVSAASPVDFDASVQSLSALDAAAYRLIGMATCRIDRVGDRFVCSLAPAANPQKGAEFGRAERTIPEPGRRRESPDARRRENRRPAERDPCTCIRIIGCQPE